MRALYLILCVSVLTGLSSCGGGNSDEPIIEYDDVDEGLDNYEAFSLAPYGIPALIYLPDATANIGAATSPEILHDMDDYKWTINVGQNFSLNIEDWGGTDAFSERVKELENQKIYKVEFLKKEDNFVYYKTILNVNGVKGRDEVGVDHESFYVMSQHKIDGINYLFITTEDGHPKPITDYMEKTVKFVKPLTEKPV